MNAIISTVFWVIVIALVLFLVFSCANIVPQQHAYVIERLGKYRTTWNAGLHFKIPVIDRIARKALLKEQVADFAPQPVITKDNVTMRIDSVVYFKVMNPHDYAYGVENPIMAMENLTATTLRNIIGDMELDATLTSRENINEKMLQTIDYATDPWGIKVTRVELKNIEPPAAIREAMEKQMKAEREKRANILTAEAEGRAEAIRAVQQATADGLRAIKEAGADDSVIRLKALEAFEKAANGQATKIIVPSDIAGMAGLAKGIVESVKEDQ